MFIERHFFEKKGNNIIKFSDFEEENIKKEQINESMNLLNYIKEINDIKLNLMHNNEEIKYLGGYMTEIIECINQINTISIEEINNDIYKTKINEIKKYFDKIKYCMYSLIEQFETYRKILGFLEYDKDLLEMSQQNQKIELMKNIINLMDKNLDVLEIYIRDVLVFYNRNKEKIFLKVIRFSLIEFVEVNELKIDTLVIDNFREYGIQQLFILKLSLRKKDNTCFIY